MKCNLYSSHVYVLFAVSHRLNQLINRFDNQSPRKSAFLSTVAARVLRKSSHILEVNHQQHHLKVKAVDYPEVTDKTFIDHVIDHINIFIDSELFMSSLCWCFSQVDFRVEATVHLNAFPSQTQVRDILRSQGFTLRDLGGGQVRVSGSFLKLRAAKASLETLLDAQAKADIRPSSSSSPVPQASSRAIPKYYTDRSDANRSQFESQNKHPAPSSPTFSSSSSSNHSTSCEHRASLKKETFVVDANVLNYAERLWKKDIDRILGSHNVVMSLHPVEDSYNITLQGRSTAAALLELQSLLDDLSKSLRVQEVHLKRMVPEGKALLERIQRNGSVYRSVLVCPKKDKLHLIGPSVESYELKQRMLGMQVDPSGRSGRTAGKTCRRRSSSLPPMSWKSTDRDGVVGAAGYTPSKYQDIKQEGTEPKQGAAAGLSGPSRRRSNSESCHSDLTGRTVSHMQDVENKYLPLKAPLKGLAPLLNFDPGAIKRMVKTQRR